MKYDLATRNAIDQVYVLLEKHSDMDNETLFNIAIKNVTENCFGTTCISGRTHSNISVQNVDTCEGPLSGFVN